MKPLNQNPRRNRRVRRSQSTLLSALLPSALLPSALLPSALLPSALLPSALLPSALLLSTALLATSLSPETATARILFLDANFDTRPVGSQLQRRGALFGEPVSGPYDRENETIVEDTPGDNSVRLEDTQILGFDELYWAFREGLGASDGKLFVSCELELEFPEDYRLMLRSEDLLSGNFFQLLFDAAGDVSWRDADDTTPSSLGFYPVGVPIFLEWDFDLDNGTYSFRLNGVEHISQETHGVLGQSLGSIVVGHRDDGDAIGSLRFDMPSVSWRPGSIPLILDADFSDHPAGVPIGTGGAELGEPVYIGGCTPIVEVGPPLGNKALMIPDESAVGSASVAFEFLDGAEPTTPLSISFWVTFDTLDDYLIYFREQGGASQVFLNIHTNSSGQVFATSDGVTDLVYNYTAGAPNRIELTFEPDFDYYSVWWNGERIIYRGEHGIAGDEVGRIYFGHLSDGDLDGVLRIDRLKVYTLDLVTPVEETVPVPAALALQAAPNPFNPATEIAFVLPRGGPVRIDVYDVRGRHVRRLLAADLPAGAHRTTWRGEDDAGRRVASGMYHVSVTSGTARQALAVTLVK